MCLLDMANAVSLCLETSVFVCVFADGCMLQSGVWGLVQERLSCGLVRPTWVSFQWAPAL